MFHIHYMEIVEKLSIESAKHYETVAHKNARVSPSWLWNGMANIYLGPSLFNGVKTVDIVDIIVVSATKDEEVGRIHDGSCMSPPS